MNDLESIVPPLDLCKQIPNGCFENSTLVWRVNESQSSAVFERVGCNLEKYPAPTLAEIIEAIKTKTYCKDLCDHKYDLHYCAIDLKWIFCFGENFAVADTLSSAALKLWLKLNKSDLSDKSDKVGHRGDQVMSKLRASYEQVMSKLSEK